MESFLSTSTVRNAIAREPILEIKIGISSDLKKLVDYEINDDEDRPIISVRCSKFNPNQITRDNQEELRDFIFKILADASARIVFFKDPEKTLTEIMRDERAHERALNFTSSFITLGNVLGHQPKTKISDWADISKKKYEAKREKPLIFKGVGEEKIIKEKSSKKPGVVPLSSAKHSEMQTISIIREPYWDEAKWLGVGYLVIPNGKTPPVLSILFENIAAGKKIFAAWKKKFGGRDKEEQIRVTIIRGIDQDNIYNYRVAIGSNIKQPGQERGGRFVASVSRLHTMTPQSSLNLQNFINAYETFRCYLLAPGYMAKGGLPDVDFKLGIIKTEIFIREAWNVGPHDIDSVAIDPSNKPIIPSNIKNPPVLGLLKMKKRRSK